LNDEVDFDDLYRKAMKKLLEKYPRTRKCPFCGNISYLETIIATNDGRYFCPECRFVFKADLNNDEILQKSIEYYNRLEERYETHVQMAKYHKILMNKASKDLRKYLLARRL